MKRLVENPLYIYYYSLKVKTYNKAYISDVNTKGADRNRPPCNCRIKLLTLALRVC